MVNLGIVGTDILCYDLVPALRKEDGIRISGIYSRDERLTGLFATSIMIQPVLIPETLIMKSDALLIFDDPAEYYDLLVRSIQLSRHLFMADLGSLGLRQIETLIKLASEAGIVIYCIQPSSRHHILPSLKELVLQPVLMDLSYTKTLASSKEPGILKSLMAEAVDALLYINQAGILKIQANAGAIASGDPDLINTRIDFANGCLGVINIFLTSDVSHFTVRVYQRGSILEANLTEEKLKQISFGKLRSEANVPIHKSTLNRDSNRDEVLRFIDLIFSNTGSVTSLESAYFSKSILQRIFDKTQIPVSA